MSFLQYYKEQYGLDIVDLDQKLLVNYKNMKGARDTAQQQKIYLVPELCRLTGLMQVQLSLLHTYKIST